MVINRSNCVQFAVKGSNKRLFNKTNIYLKYHSFCMSSNCFVDCLYQLTENELKSKPI